MDIGPGAATAIAVLLLSGCAHDSYAVRGGSASEARMHADAKECALDAVKTYYDRRNGVGVMVGAFVGGPVGAAAGYAVDESDDKLMKLSELKPTVENCMRAKGYEPNADNDP